MSGLVDDSTKPSDSESQDRRLRSILWLKRPNESSSTIRRRLYWGLLRGGGQWEWEHTREGEFTPELNLSTKITYPMSSSLPYSKSSDPIFLTPKKHLTRKTTNLTSEGSGLPRETSPNTLTRPLTQKILDGYWYTPLEFTSRSRSTQKSTVVTGLGVELTLEYSLALGHRGSIGCECQRVGCLCKWTIYTIVGDLFFRIMGYLFTIPFFLHVPPILGLPLSKVMTSVSF